MQVKVICPRCRGEVTAETDGSQVVLGVHPGYNERECEGSGQRIETGVAFTGASAPDDDGGSMGGLSQY